MSREVLHRCVVIIALATFSSFAWAHDMNLFVQVQGDSIVGRVTYPPDLPVADCTIEVQSKNSDPPSTTTTNADGTFAVKVSGPADYIITARTLDLHQAVKDVSASQFAGSAFATSGADKSGTGDQDRWRQELRSEIGQLREQMNRLEESIGFRDILGAIGLIIGAFGLIYFLKQRGARR